MALLLDQLPNLSKDEGPNLINALSRVVHNGDLLNLRDIIENRIAAAADDVQMRTRFLTVAAQCGFTEPLSQDCVLRENPWRRTAFIHGFADFPGDLDRLAELLERSDIPPETRSALCVAVGRLGEAARQATQDVLKKLYLTAIDGGTHSAAGWALQQQGVTQKELQHLLSARPETDATVNWRFFEDVAGLTMIRIPSHEFALGSVTDDVGGGEDSGWTGDPTGNDVSEVFPSIWMSDREISVAQFEAILPKFEDTSQENAAKVPLSRQLPVAYVSWYDAVEFCNELSEQQELEPFYKIPNDAKRDEAGHITSAEVSLNEEGSFGYRLPTEQEWEYTCRSLSAQGYCFGESTEYLGDYAVFNTFKTDFGGRKIPNAWGLFDMHGNLWEWCDDKYDPEASDSRVLRGGSFFSLSPQYLRSANRVHDSPGSRDNYFGFRISRTP